LENKVSVEDIQECARKLVTFSFRFLKISTIRNKDTPKRPTDAPMTTSIKAVDGDSINFNWTTYLICIRHRWTVHECRQNPTGVHDGV